MTNGKAGSPFRHRAGSPSGEPAVRLGPRFARAVEWACEIHGTQSRKGGDVPYVSHLLGVAALVLDAGGSENEAIAALLHDSIEDAGIKPDKIRKRFGPKVARIVEGCTDVPTEGKAARRALKRRSQRNWHKRKRRSIRHLADPSTPKSVLRVRAADLLWNARSTVADVRREGPDAWRRFNAGPADQLWYYRSASAALSQRLPGALSDELRAAVGESERLAGGCLDVGDPASKQG